jgi:hypothetical protein
VFVKGLNDALRVYRASVVDATQPAPAASLP